ncbi:MAG: AhpC/TSA family protein [Bacteroidaceae bacterium]|nr:AhpC/TSA family protein [Bacteroidaceae bacterium]
MRKTFPLLILLACCVSCTTQQAFTIRGTIPGLPAGVEIGLLSAEGQPSDEIAAATVTKDGEFFITGQIDHPTLCTLTTNNLAMINDEVTAGNYEHVRWTYTPVFLDNVDMEIQVPSYDLVPDAPQSKDFHIVGNDVHDEYCEYLSQVGDRPTSSKVLEFIEQHPTSVVSLYAANKILTNGYNLSFDYIQRLEQVITGCPKDTARYSEFLRRAQLAEKTAVGSTIIDLDMLTPDGTRCQLADIVAQHKGKYLLIDFWASWCGICRAGTPRIKEYYAQYPREQFEVISVSSDEKDDLWRAAMEKDDMPWAQYCLTPQGMKDFYEKYQTIGVPYYLLVAPDGTVLANPGGVENVGEMLENILN